MITDEGFNKEDLASDVLNFLAGMEIESTEAVVSTTIDMTLTYVVDWLQSTGNKAKAEILENLGDIL